MNNFVTDREPSPLKNLKYKNGKKMGEDQGGLYALIYNDMKNETKQFMI